MSKSEDELIGATATLPLSLPLLCCNLFDIEIFMLKHNLALKNPELVKQWHPTKNGDLTPDLVSAGSGKKAWWKCPAGDDHEWEAVIASRAKNNCGCPYCSGRQADKNNNLEKQNPELLKEWHPTKNEGVKPSDFTPRSGRMVWWKCVKGEDHDWKSSIVNRVKGNGCPICSGRNAVKSNSLSTLRPNLKDEWHPIKNGKLTPNEVTLGSNRRVWWKCPRGDDHEWQAAVHDRADGGICPVCANRKIVKSNCLETLRPDLVFEWHPTKNGKHTPQNVHPGSSFKIWWRCKHGHEWKTSLDHRGRGTGCPKCSKGTTLPELRILSELRTIFPSIEHREKIGGYEIDLFLPTLKIGIEYDGVHWHKDKYERDKDKNRKLEPKLLLIRVRERGLSKISDHDILLSSRDLSIDTIKSILQVLLDHRKKIDLETLNKINKYLEEEGWTASKHFKKLCTERNQIDFIKSLSQLYPELVNEWHPSKNQPLLPEHFSSGSHKKVWWICPNGEDHIWKAPIHSRTKGSGCPICSGHKIVNSNSLSEQYPDLAKEWHPKKNKNLRPIDVSPGTHKKAWWKCQKGHEWDAVIRHRVSGIGCPYCSNKRVSDDNCLATTHPELSKEWNTKKNKGISPADITYGVGRKVWWKCECGNEWEATVSNRARRGDACPKCRKQK